MNFLSDRSIVIIRRVIAGVFIVGAAAALAFIISAMLVGAFLVWEIVR